MVTILLVDDDPKTEAMINLVLNTSYNQNFELLGVARSEKEAKEMIVFFKPQILILGDMIKNLTLPKLLPLNYVCFAEYKFVVAENKDYAYDCLKYGVQDYLLKPLTASSFEKALLPFRKDIPVDEKE